MKLTITSAERAALVAVLTRAATHNAALHDLVQEASRLTGDYDPLGHTADVVHTCHDGPAAADVLLAQLHITIADAGR
jgi:hypothetical protein